MASQENWPASDMLRGLSASVEVNGHLVLDTVDVSTQALGATGVSVNLRRPHATELVIMYMPIYDGNTIPSTVTILS